MRPSIKPNLIFFTLLMLQHCLEKKNLAETSECLIELKRNTNDIPALVNALIEVISQKTGLKNPQRIHQNAIFIIEHFFQKSEEFRKEFLAQRGLYYIVHHAGNTHFHERT